MATAEQPYFMWIPPPPLPEFYLAKDQLGKTKNPSSSSSSSSSGTDVEDKVAVNEESKFVKVTYEKKQSESDLKKGRSPAVAGDGAYDGLPPPPYRYVSVPPQPARATGSNDVPPLAVYHICRICLRPRSARYHREHPIPVNGVPPPPGICRRCRVTSVNETSEIDISDVDEVVRKGRSNEIKIGCIAPFIPEDAIISNEEAKRIQAQRYLRGRAQEPHITIFREASSGSQYRRPRNRSRRSDIIYRHVKVVQESEHKCDSDRTSRKPTKELQRHVRYERRKEQTAGTYVELQEDQEAKAYSSPKGTNLAKTDSIRDSRSSQIPSSSSSSSTIPAVKAAAETIMLKRPEHTDSEIRKIAGEEAQRYAKSERPESDIRRIAHQEISRYREAERKLETRPGAFAHVKMVSVQQQAQDKQDRSSATPWKDAPKAISDGRVAPLAEPLEQKREKSVTSASYLSSQSRTGSERESWGPQWRRELSLERRRSNEMTDERWGVEAVEESRSKTSVPPSDLPRSDEPRSTCNVVRDSDAPCHTSKTQAQVPSDIQQKPGKPTFFINGDEDAEMGLLFPPTRSRKQQDDFDRERETVERLSVRSSAPPARHKKPTRAPSDKAKSREYRKEIDVVRDTVDRSSGRWDTSGSGGTPHDSVRSSVKPWERGSEEHVRFLMEKEQSKKRGARPPAIQIQTQPAGTRQGSNVHYEYKLHTVRPADQADIQRSPNAVSPKRSGSPGHMTLEVWQQVPTDPLQRAREASMHEKERNQAVEWLKARKNDPTAQVGVDSDGSRRIACSIPHRGSDWRQPRSHPRLRRPSPRETAPLRNDRSPDRWETAASKHSTGPRGGRGEVDAGDWPDREMVIEVWEQVPAKEAARYRRQNFPSPCANDGRHSGRTDASPEEVVIEAWMQVPSKERPASNVRKDSVMDMPPGRRRRERRAHHKNVSEDSTHVKFSGKVDISPTPPGSDESSNAFRRFHDFVGRKATRQQNDGHDSEERGEDLIAEYERRGRLRSRESTRRKGDYACNSRDARDRDETVRPREGQRRYDGKRNERWRPIQRALSESPSREGSDRKRSSVKSGPPYRPDEKPTASMTTRDGSRSSGRWW